MLEQTLLILTTNPELPTIKALAKYLHTQAIEVRYLNPFSETSLISPVTTKGIWILPRTSGVLFDDIDLHLCEAWVARGAQCLISIESIKKLRDKDRQYLLLKERGLPMLKTLVHRGELKEEHLNKLTCHGHEWVLKSIRGNKGIGIEKFTTGELLEAWEKALKRNDQRYLIQEFLAQARELRILCLGHKLYAIKKINKDANWKKNAQYAKFEKADLNNNEKRDFLTYAQIIKKELNLPCFAIDLIFDDKNNQWQILEVNVHPGLAASNEAIHQKKDKDKDKSKDLYEQYWQALRNSTYPQQLNF